MDEKLFRKHILQIQKINDGKDELCEYIKESTGIELLREEIVVVKKTVTIQTSSAKKSILIQKKIKNILQEKGYTFNS